MNFYIYYNKYPLIPEKILKNLFGNPPIILSYKSINLTFLVFLFICFCVIQSKKFTGKSIPLHLCS